MYFITFITSLAFKKENEVLRGNLRVSLRVANEADAGKYIVRTYFAAVDSFLEMFLYVSELYIHFQEVSNDN